MGISVREAERCINADLFLDEYPRWESGGPHYPYILQQMFAHIETAGQKEHDCAICWGCQQPLPEWDASVETPTVELVGYKTTQEEIRALYNEVYQLKRAPRMVPCDPEMEKEIYQQSLDLLKECLQHRWGPAQSKEPRWGPISTRAPRIPAQVDFHAKTQDAYDLFQNRHHESCKKALRVAWDAHHQVLAAANPLDGHIERLSCSVSCRWSGSHGWSGSHQCLHSGGHSKSCRRCPQMGQQEQVPLVVGCIGDSADRQTLLPSPARLGRQVTFVEHSTGGDTSVWEVPSLAQMKEVSNRSELAEGDLGPHPLLNQISSTSWVGTCPCMKQKGGGTPSKI